MKPASHVVLAILIACGVCPLLGQQTKILPSLDISGSSLDAAVSYDSVRHVYVYRYTIRAAATNKAPIDCFTLDLSGRVGRTQTDPDLHENFDRTKALQAQPATMIPAGITVPDPDDTAVIFGKNAALVICSREKWDVQPGSTAGGFVIESKFPPGLRRALLVPSSVSQEQIIQQSSMDDEFVNEDGATSYKVALTIPGPSDPDMTALFEGDGPSSGVNAFLRYSRPTESRTTLPGSTTAYTVIVFYGASILPGTFRATLGGKDVSALFKVQPGSGEAVTLNLVPGTSKLHLSVDGVKAGGSKGTDSDTLTFVVP